MLKPLLYSIFLISLTACGVSQSSPVPTVPLATPPPPTEATPPVSFQPQLANITIPVEDIVTLLPRDAIPAILPQQLGEMMIPAQEVHDLPPDIQVMGVSINGESHAYPIPFLSRHEIINTTLGGRKIAATW